MLIKLNGLNERRCYVIARDHSLLVLADVIIYVYEVPCMFWHYVNVDKVS